MAFSYWNQNEPTTNSRAESWTTSAALTTDDVYATSFGEYDTTESDRLAVEFVIYDSLRPEADGER